MLKYLKPPTRKKIFSLAFVATKIFFTSAHKQLFNQPISGCITLVN